jgi:NAD(P)-dependent dehydrogenase (short-subunit alcohol dehydrogenase family)
MGRATAILFAREGAAVVASGRDPQRGRALVEEIGRGGGRVEFVAGDVGLPETKEQLVETCRRLFGGVDVAVCCVGMLGLGSATGVPLETWRQTIAVNLEAVFYLMRSALPEMQQWKRLGRQDAARAALFLASSGSEWITGTVLTVDGGIMAGA